MNLQVNPWLNALPSEGPYVLEIDRKDIERHNAWVADKAKVKVIVGSIPEPFIGSFETASVVLLGLNPGHAPTDEQDHRDVEMQKAMFLNLNQESQAMDYPFYPLNPKFRKTGVANWWLPRTRELREAADLEPAMFARRLLVVEWFPYHSERFAIPRKLHRICESQEYSFQLAKQLLEKKLVIGMRSKRRWLEVDQRFGNIPFLKNPQCGSISRGNTETGIFDEIVRAIRQDA